MSGNIPRAFLDTLVAKLGTTKRQVYKNIGNIAAAKHVTSRTAAFILDYERGINYQKYVTPDDLAEMRAVQLAGSAQTLQRQAAPTTTKKVASKQKAPAPIKQSRNNSVFVVHGRDTVLNEDMFALLRALGLNPMEWAQAIAKAKGANPNVGAVINNAMKQVQGVIVLFSPDEQARLKSRFATPREKGEADKLADQARPNVIFEAGLALGAHPEKTLLVQIGNTRPISDIAGMHMLHLSNSSASRKELAQRLKTKLKFKVDTTGTSWLEVGNFDR